MRFFWLIALLFLQFIHLSAQNIPVVKITDLDKRLKNGGDTLFIVNFWATWCAPCVKEIPDFIKAAETFQAQKVKLLLVSLDDVGDKALVADFQREREIKQEILLLDEYNANYWIPFIDADWGGAIPVTLFWKAQPNLRVFVASAMHYEEIVTILEKQE